MTNTKEFKVLLFRRGITLEALAEAIGLSYTSLSYKINNKREFLVSEILKIQHYLGFSNDVRDSIFFCYQGDSESSYEEKES